MAKKAPVGPLERAFGITPAEGAQLAERWATLTPREREVAALIAAGVKNAEIAKQLGISSKTQDIHRAKAAWKLGVPPVGFGRVHFYLRAAEELGTKAGA